MFGFARAYRRGFKPFPSLRGSWEDRLADLFDCGVDFRGKTVLDAGCFMGVLDYELDKRHPAFIHGIDSSRRTLDIARSIFRYSTTPHRFDRIDLTRTAKLEAMLQPSYDIVLFMSVYMHIVKRRGREAGDTVARTLARRCKSDFITRVQVPDR